MISIAPNDVLPHELTPPPKLSYEMPGARRLSQASGTSTSSASLLERELVDAFPSVPQDVPDVSTLDRPRTLLMAPSVEGQEPTRLSPFTYNHKPLTRSVTMPSGPRARGAKGGKD
jgi:hypothetical protein